MQNPVESLIKVKQDDICLAFMIQVKSQLQVVFSLQELYSCRATLWKPNCMSVSILWISRCDLLLRI